MVYAKRWGRINVWPTRASALAASAMGGRRKWRLIVWRTSAQAEAHRTWPEDGGGGSVPYTALAVHFDGATDIHTTSLISTDNTKFSFVCWINLVGSANAGKAFCAADAAASSAVLLNFRDGSSGEAADAEIFLSNADNTIYETIDTTADAINTPGWRCFIGSFDLMAFNFGKFYIGDIDVTNFISSHGSAPGIISTNGLPFYVGQDGLADFILGDLADVRIMPGISLLGVGGDILEATRRLFIDAAGKPVDPAVATAALGAPAILFSGDASPGGFDLNQGTGGAFTLTGTLANASTSPSD